MMNGSMRCLGSSRITITGVHTAASAGLLPRPACQQRPWELHLDTNPLLDDGDRGKPSLDCHGDRRTNATYRSVMDPEARRFRKGKEKEANRVFMTHVLMENRQRPVGGLPSERSDGDGERDALPVY